MCQCLCWRDSKCNAKIWKIIEIFVLFLPLHRFKVAYFGQASNLESSNVFWSCTIFTRAKAYVESSQAFIMEIFRENSSRVNAVNYFRKKSCMIDVQLSSKYISVEMSLRFKKWNTFDVHIKVDSHLPKFFYYLLQW